MNLLLTEQQISILVENFLNEDDYNNIHDWFEFQDTNLREIFGSINNKEKIKMFQINPNQYKMALQDFVKYNGMFNRFPVKYVYRWKRIMLENTAMLENLTSIHGHSNHFPFDEFYDTFNYTESYQSNQYNLFSNELEDITPDGEYSVWAIQKYKETGNKDYIKENDFGSIYEFLEYKNIDDYVPFFSNGQPVLSDYGLPPLSKLAEKLLLLKEPEEIIVMVNRMLDITHPRSDLAELFIQGGSDSLDDIHYNMSNPEKIEA